MVCAISIIIIIKCKIRGQWGNLIIALLFVVWPSKFFKYEDSVDWVKCTTFWISVNQSITVMVIEGRKWVTFHSCSECSTLEHSEQSVVGLVFPVHFGISTVCTIIRSDSLASSSAPDCYCGRLYIGDEVGVHYGPLRGLDCYEMASPQRVIGSLGDFDSKTDNIVAYVERVSLYFEANDVKDDQKVPVLLTMNGAKTYVTLRSILAPVAQREKTFDELAETLRGHFDQKPLIVGERFKFYQRSLDRRVDREFCRGSAPSEYFKRVRGVSGPGPSGPVSCHSDQGRTHHRALRARASPLSSSGLGSVRSSSV